VNVHRFFVRLVSFITDVHLSEAEALFVEALDHLGLAIGSEESIKQNNKSNKVVQNVSFAANHVFLNVVGADASISLSVYERELRRICEKYWFKMVRLCVSTVEFKFSCKVTTDGDSALVRLVASNPTGNNPIALI
jgi:hypothetical protein